MKMPSSLEAVGCKTIIVSSSSSFFFFRFSGIHCLSAAHYVNQRHCIFYIFKEACWDNWNQGKVDQIRLLGKIRGRKEHKQKSIAHKSTSLDLRSTICLSV